MNFKLIFLVALVLMAVCLGESEGRPFKKFLRKLRGAGRRVANAAQKAAPLALGVRGVLG
ncbi:cecropin-C-like [Anopheles marshallii]|uniref:cecropin-C-like n=1 Tax=Anopheles marshallii TaxID=1521116 RepID=UPI00237B1F2E|nr:cecropin-C-like [Anopheles marshallii]